MTTLAPAVPRAIAQPQKVRSLGELAWRRFLRNRLAIFGLVLFGILFLVTMLGPFIYTVDPIKPNAALAFKKPFSPLLGADDLGRDVLARVLFGGRISIAVGIAAMLAAVIIGTIVGAFSGFFGGKVDFVLMRITDLFLSLPAVPITLLISFLFRETLTKTFGTLLGPFIMIVAVIGGLNWMANARLVRSSFLELRGREFVEASRSLGQGRLPIMFTHILPNAIGPIVVAATLNVGQAIISESVLSFLGVGFPSDTPTWGKLVADYSTWLGILDHVILPPAFLIFLTVLCVNFVGDGLRDALDPRSKR